MAENVKLKDLYADEKVYDGINTVEIPKADGTGKAKFIVPPSQKFMLRESDYQEDYVQGSSTTIAVSEDDTSGGFVFVSIANAMMHMSEPKIIRVANFAKDPEGFVAYHSMAEQTITEFMTRIFQSEAEKSVVVTPDTYVVKKGWTNIISTVETEGNIVRVAIEKFEQIADPSAFTFDASLPWYINEGKENYFYAYIAEATQQVKSVSVTENGTQIINPDSGKSGLTAVQLSVDVAGGGGTASSAKRNDVTFIDYDGSILYSYSLEESKELTELPALPSHDGLVCQGWNWTLEEIKALNRPVTVGAMYITDDGATRLHIRIATVGRMTVPLYIGQTVANGVSIDWGDGSTAETLAWTGNVNTSHTYAEPGDYVILLMPTDGCTLSFGDGSSSYCVMGSTGNNGKVYCNMIQEVYVGKNVTSIGNYAFQSCSSLASITIPTGVTSIGNYAFSRCYSLASITIPNGVTSIGDYAFNGCYSLASITIPTGVTSIGSSAFQNCYSLASITIPNGVTSIDSSAFNYCSSLASITIPTGVTSIRDSAFNYCYSLASITIPNGVTSIRDSAFYNCYGMRYYDFSSCTAIPNLSNKNAFNNIPSDCKMLIPSALYNNWKSATNWATYASKMVSV